MAVQMNKQNLGGASSAQVKKVQKALEQLSPDQSGALALATTVNGHTTQLTELGSKVGQIDTALATILGTSETE